MEYKLYMNKVDFKPITCDEKALHLNAGDQVFLNKQTYEVLRKIIDYDNDLCVILVEKTLSDEEKAIEEKEWLDYLKGLE